MKKLVAPTEDFIKVEGSALAANVTAGSAVTITLENNNGMSNGDFIVIGYPGNELCEMVQIDAVVTAGQTIHVATVKFNHLIGEPVMKYRYNKRKFYGSTSPTGSFAEITADGSPVNIQVDDPQGTVLEYTGSTYTYFKSTYFNSSSSEETAVADSTAVAGDQTLRYASLYGIRKHAGLAGNPLYSDLRLEQKRMQAESEINSYIYAQYVLPLTEIPAMITYICELLAAGYIDYEEFGKDGEGVKWLGTARSLLKSLSKGEQVLIGADGNPLTSTSSSGMQGYPDQVDDVNGPGRMFTTRQVF